VVHEIANNQDELNSAISSSTILFLSLEHSVTPGLWVAALPALPNQMVGYYPSFS